MSMEAADDDETDRNRRDECLDRDGSFVISTRLTCLILASFESVAVTLRMQECSLQAKSVLRWAEGRCHCSADQISLQ
jgi:hypothetical protein